MFMHAPTISSIVLTVTEEQSFQMFSITSRDQFWNNASHNESFHISKILGTTKSGAAVIWAVSK